MAINYSNTVKNARLQAVADALAAGATPGLLQIGTAAMASVLVEIPVDDPPVVASQILTLLAAPETAEAIATGTAAAARLVDANDTVIATGLTVGTSGTDVVLDSTSITLGQDVTINSAAITHAA